MGMICRLDSCYLCQYLDQSPLHLHSSLIIPSNDIVSSSRLERMLVLSTETRGDKVENLYVADEGGLKNGL